MRLTDVDRLRTEVLKWLPSDPCEIEEKEIPYETDIAVSMILTLEEAPCIDIVRCKECKHRDEDECKWDTTRSLPKDDDFCSFGESKESK